MIIRFEQWHEINNNIVYATSKGSDQIWTFASRLNILWLFSYLTQQHLEFLSWKGGYTGSSESTLVKMPHCWKSHVTAHLYLFCNCDWCFNSACWVIFHVFVAFSWLFFLNKLFQKILSGILISVLNSLGPDQDRHFVGPDLHPNCLQK